MRSTLQMFLALTLVALVTVTSFAQEEGKKKKKGPGQPQAINQVLKRTEALGLSEEQQKKVKEIAASHAPKFTELNQKLSGQLTDAQKKARQEAVAKNKADGKKGKEAAAAIEAALALTDDQKKVQKDVQAELKELGKKLNDEVAAVLTPEQKEKFSPPKKKKAA